MELQDVTWPSQDDVILLASSDSVPDAPTLEEYDNGASGSFYSPSTSANSPVSTSSMIAPPRQRVAHKCSHCGKCFIYRYKVLEHQRLHTGENPYKCSQCGKSFRRSCDMSSHRRTHHLKRHLNKTHNVVQKQTV
ncbi:Zinc finger protein ZFMSA12A [Dissostichus eleginoides]|uniref:Zinc finger protein ZFMSA12A n=1 Tax=Dissostichus eleginoides TaxID=100907 RepID=A0AAD9AZV2_DISEL|nr:Zinc finger protein ZFMSA12A [Dissostichus eleginoides]